MNKLVFFALLFPASSAWAQERGAYALPPLEQPLEVDDQSAAPEPLPPPSAPIRLSIGPGLRLAQGAPFGGLAAFADFGGGAAGARLSGIWVRAGHAEGLSQYGAELWIDFAGRSAFHPIVGAGIGVGRVEGPNPQMERTTYNLGVGILRGTLEYVLPVHDAHARVGVDAMGSVPAITTESAPEVGPWALVIARVGVGF